MLKLLNICKTYEMADQRVDALKNITLEFRKNEFVSILGPSGCGKTTMLNIIGGLDRYTSGDLVINEISTKSYKDKDWDNYRNHSVGFVFQSYNLIPHQTVLENVELALTLSGVTKKERRTRAIEILTKVGLKDKIKSKPNQLSGGQMQRVAIARALVNDPEIILADEPTGALDTTTSVQIMELLKEISKDKLIIMVTHNPELAEKYSSRIVRLLDGKMVDDTNPYESRNENTENNIVASNEKNLKPKKKRMSFFTALFLSLKNLLTKKGRTILVSFAGSIGIIGIALVLAISNGFSSYVNKMQEDTLSTYPLTISAKNVDFTSIVMSVFLDNDSNTTSDHDKDNVYSKDRISTIINSVGSNLRANDLQKFYIYLNENKQEIEDYISAIQYNYNIGLELYQQDNTSVQPNSPALMKMIVKYSLFYFEQKTNVKVTQTLNGGCILEKTENTDYTFVDSYAELSFIKTGLENNGRIELSSSQVMSLVFTILGFGKDTSTNFSSSSAFKNMQVASEMIDNDKLIKEQYDLISGDFMTNSDEAMLVLDKNNELDDYILYALGLISDEQIDNTLKSLVQGHASETKINYESIIGKEYKVLCESDYYVEHSGNIIDIRTFNNTKNEDGTDNPNFDPEKYLYYYSSILNNCSNKVKIVGILRLNESTDAGSSNAGLIYSKNLTNKMVNHHKNSIAVQRNIISEIKLDIPSSINIYVNSFESKAKIQEFIDKYNSTAQNGDEITFTDMVGLIMNTVSTIITSITYVLVAFVSVSLIVSSIMIGIITYISVIERTKEIGILRSVGASKKDIKRVFNAESFIIGFSSGAMGIIISALLLLPINLILKHFTGLSSLATLPILGIFILIAISVVLTLIAGFVPANIAAKKDPVVALRSE